MLAFAMRVGFTGRAQAQFDRLGPRQQEELLAEVEQRARAARAAAGRAPKVVPFDAAVAGVAFARGLTWESAVLVLSVQRLAP